jgi:hypothetical protein
MHMMGLSKKIAKRVSDYQNPNSIGTKLRVKRIAPLIMMIKNTYEMYGKVDIIDVGGTKTYWRIFPEDMLQEKKVKITLINLPGTKVPEENRFFTFREGNGCDLHEIDDGAFHIAHSNSVIEHVGDWDMMMRFSHEISRVSNSYFVQTPNYWFPIEPHFMTPFFHWLPRPLRMLLIMRFDLGHRKKQDSINGAIRSIESVRLLDRKMFSELFPDAMIITERVLLLPKSLIAIKNVQST